MPSVSQYARLDADIKALLDLRAEINKDLLSKIERLWNARRPMNPAVWYAKYGGQVVDLVIQAQLEVATLAQIGVGLTLEYQGLAEEPEFNIDPAAFAGRTGDGRTVEGLVYAQAQKVAEAVDRGGEPWEVGKAWRDGAWGLQLAVQTALADTNRQAKLLQTQAYKNAKWIRVVRPPCCARCAILAGKEGGRNMNFDRHPGCDCDAIPVSVVDDGMAKGWMFSPQQYFDSLSLKDQERIFGKYGSQAIRDGADINQVVNVRRGLKVFKDTVGHRNVVSHEGITRRGVAGKAIMEHFHKDWVKRHGHRYRMADRYRYTPERIYELAKGDKAEALRLLKINGYIGEIGYRQRLAAVRPDIAGGRAKIRSLTREDIRTAARITKATSHENLHPKIRETIRKLEQASEGDAKEYLSVSKDSIDRTVDIAHVLGLRVRRDRRVEGGHHISQLRPLRAMIRKGEVEISAPKSYFPAAVGDRAALTNWLIEPGGVVDQILDSPDRVVKIPQGGFLLSRVCEMPNGGKIEMILPLVPAGKKSTYEFKLPTIYPLRGNGVIYLSEKGVQLKAEL